MLYRFLLFFSGRFSGEHLQRPLKTSSTALSENHPLGVTSMNYNIIWCVFQKEDPLAQLIDWSMSLLPGGRCLGGLPILMAI